jgi:hypothetical protein
LVDEGVLTVTSDELQAAMTAAHAATPMRRTHRATIEPRNDMTKAEHSSNVALTAPTVQLGCLPDILMR